MPNVIDYTDLRVRSGKVIEHLAEDPRIVTVRLDELGDEPEDFKVLYSILKFENEEIIAMQDTIDSFLSESPAAGTGTAATLIGYNDLVAVAKLSASVGFPSAIICNFQSGPGSCRCM